MGQLKNQRKKIKNQCQKGKMGKVQGLVCRRSLTVSVEYFNWEEQMLVLFCFCIILLRMQITGTNLLIDHALFKGTIFPPAGRGWGFLPRLIQTGSKAEHRSKFTILSPEKKGELMLGKQNKQNIDQTNRKQMLTTQYTPRRRGLTSLLSMCSQN